MKKAIICDIDGCVLDTDWIWEEIEKQKLDGLKKWEFFNKNSCDLEKSEPQDLLIKLINGDMFSMQHELIFSTARSEIIRKETREILEKMFAGRDFILLMRPEDCLLPSWQVKEQHLNEILKNYEVTSAIDNEEPNCEMYRRHKINCLEWNIEEQKQKMELVGC